MNKKHSFIRLFALPFLFVPELLYLYANLTVASVFSLIIGTSIYFLYKKTATSKKELRFQFVTLAIIFTFIQVASHIIFYKLFDIISRVRLTPDSPLNTFYSLSQPNVLYTVIIILCFFIIPFGVEMYTSRIKK